MSFTNRVLWVVQKYKERGSGSLLMPVKKQCKGRLEACGVCNTLNVCSCTNLVTCISYENVIVNVRAVESVLKPLTLSPS